MNNAASRVLNTLAGEWTLSGQCKRRHKAALNEQSRSPVGPRTHKTTHTQFYLPFISSTLAFRGHAVTTTIKRQEMCEQFLRHPGGLIPLSLSRLLIVVVDLPVSGRGRLPRRSKWYYQVRRCLLLWRRSTVARRLLRVPWRRLVWT